MVWLGSGIWMPNL
uniref:Uncharacterized protein n=1 Tax=Arundo donax TaxID=35708 RepID=A0A0A9EFE1_ARUDO